MSRIPLFLCAVVMAVATPSIALAAFPEPTDPRCIFITRPDTGQTFRICGPFEDPHDATDGFDGS